MIRIFVKGNELALYRNTTMTVELNNALFASPDIEGDISFSFTIPVEGNERTLKFAHLPQADSVKKLPCTVYCNGGLNWNGELLVQSGGRDSITAALVINPYPEGFGNRSLTENEDEDTVISDSRETHDLRWEQFLTASLEDPDVKFAPFINEDGYGSENTDFGYWNGQQRSKVVNALFFLENGEFIDGESHPFSKMHNAALHISVPEGEDADGEPLLAEYTEANQLAFCPQIRIARVMETWCRNAGYRLVNHLGEDFNATFLQSQKSLDGTVFQYGGSVTVVRGASREIHQPVNGGTTTGFRIGIHPCDAASEPWVAGGRMTLPSSGWWRFTIAVELVVKRESWEYWSDWADYVNIAVCLTDGEYRFENLMDGTGVIKKWEYSLGDEKTGGRNLECEARVAASGRIYLQDGSLSGLSFTVFAYHRNSKRIYDIERISLTAEAAEISPNSEQRGFNIFRNRFNIPELLPDVTNSSFLKTMLETMGLCYFVSAKTKTAELLPYALMRGAKSLDLTDFEMTRETETAAPEETLRTFRLAPLKDEEYDEELRLADADGHRLPDAYTNHERYILLKKTNTLYRAAPQEHEELTWVEDWAEHSGNPDRLETGSGGEENREPSVRIPHQRFFNTNRRHRDTDALTGETPQLMVAGFTISSDLYNTGEKPSDIILTQYRGLRPRQYGARTTVIKNEVMLPVWADGFALTARGENSLGEKYVKPVLELLGHRTITYKFRLPASLMQTVEALLRPSELEPGRQTRFLIVRNVKSVPKRITFQIDNTVDETVLCQIEAVKVY